MSELAKKRIREIIEDQLKQATTALALMENNSFWTHEIVDGREVNTTDKSIANRKTEIRNLTEALEQIDSLTLD